MKNSLLAVVLFVALALVPSNPTAASEDGFVMDKSFTQTLNALGTYTVDQLAVGEHAYVSKAGICLSAERQLYIRGYVPLLKEGDFGSVRIDRLPGKHVRLTVNLGNSATRTIESELRQILERAVWGRRCELTGVEPIAGEVTSQYLVVSINGTSSLSELIESHGLNASKQ